METVDYLRVVRRRWWIIVLLTGITGLLTYGVSKRLTPIYRAEGTLLLNLAPGATAPNYNDVTASQALTKTYAQLVSAHSTLEDVAQRLGNGVTASTLQGLSATDVPLTELIRISYENASGDFAAQVVNTAAGVLVERVGTAQQSNAAGTSAPATPAAPVNALYVVDRAVVSPQPVFPRTALYTGLAAVTGFLISICMIVLLEYRDALIYGGEELEHLGLPFVGAIQHSRNAGKEPLNITFPGPRTSRLAEEYRQLSTTIEFLALDCGIRSLAITSALPKEGRTTTAVNLASALAQTGRQVILVDGDMRRPSVHTSFKLENSYGVTNALHALPEDVDALLQNTPVTGLRVLTTGPLPPDPAELLASTKMRALMAKLKQHADLVILDTPPCSTAADAMILAARADAALLVIDLSHTRASEIRTAISRLSRSRTRLLGALLNNAHKDSVYHHYYARSNGINSIEASTLPVQKSIT